MVDSSIMGTVSPKCLRRFVQIAGRCVHIVPKQRPAMTEVVALLQALLELQEKSKDFAQSSGIMSFPWKMHKYFASNSDQSGTSSPKSVENNMNQQELMTRDLKMFTYNELNLATKNFGKAAFFGEGSCGKVYRGWVDNFTYSPSVSITKLPVAIKKLDRYKVFDLEMLNGVRHPNLVKLIGYCLESGCLYVVHEFMRRGTFEDLLQRGAVAGLPLLKKVKIVVGIARAIDFLQKTWPGVGQSWLGRHMILLDEDFTTKLSDYDVGYMVNGHHRCAYLDTDKVQLVLQCDPSGYEVIFIEVVTGERLYNLHRVKRIDGFFTQSGKESLSHIARLCLEMCNDDDSELKMLTILKEHDKLIQRSKKLVA
ncbi:serine/threonine-protein kinase BIK1-like [Bidens hawaiensis]|uniref:serine/threonine-protein kinase BIK1-like n=1 Tax=Bidens hawaiensis TaxID=980011 RepID=UPI004049BC9C